MSADELGTTGATEDEQAILKELEAAATETEEEGLNAILAERIDINHALAIFRLKPDGWELPDFKPGQFSMVGLPPEQSDIDKNPKALTKSGKPKMVRRAYSIASSPLKREYLDLYIVRIDDGQLTPKLWRLNPGDRLFLDRKMRGKFTLDGVPEGKDIVMVSTGTGLAPTMSMLDTYQGTGRWRRMVIINGCRYSIDLGYREQLEKAAQEDSSIIYIPMVTRDPEDSGYNGVRGRVPKLFDEDMYEGLVGAPFTAEDCHLFLCGNPDMVKYLKAKAEGQGFRMPAKGQPGNIHLELYW